MFCRHCLNWLPSTGILVGDWAFCCKWCFHVHWKMYPKERPYLWRHQIYESRAYTEIRKNEQCKLCIQRNEYIDNIKRMKRIYIQNVNVKK